MRRPGIRMSVRVVRTFAAREFSARASLTDFEDIPTVNSLPMTMSTALPKLVSSSSQLHWYVNERHKLLGPIFKEQVGPISCVFVSDPCMMRSVFMQEGQYPGHILPEPWIFYNELYRCSRGLFFMEGEEWLQFRRIMNKLLLKGNLKWIEESCKSVSKYFIASLPRNEEVSNLENALYKLSLDAIVGILLGTELYENAHKAAESRVKYLSQTIRSVFETTADLSNIPSKIAYDNQDPNWKKFERSMGNALESGSELVEFLSREFPHGDGLLSKMQEEMSAPDIARIVTDLVLAAGDTTAYTAEWILYMISKHRDVQDNLRRRIINKEEEKDVHVKNVVRETLRLFPVAPFLTRIVKEPLVISGYSIPPGVPIIMSIFTSGRNPNYFEYPEKFLPDRWLTPSYTQEMQLQAVLSFAMGVRSCIGRKVAEFLLHSVIENVVANFKVELLQRKDINVIMRMIPVPEEEIRLKFLPL